MRTFSSYGPINKNIHYYVDRENLIKKGISQLLGEPVEDGGHYITVWAPRQCGKTWIMREVLWFLKKNKKFDVIKLNLEHLKMTQDPYEIVSQIGHEIIEALRLKPYPIKNFKEFQKLFTKEVLKKPLILIMDEFDALEEEAISGIAGAFRNIYNIRQEDPNPTEKKEYLLHGVALIGVRSVLGIENAKGSPFNVQRSLHIPNLTFEEVEYMFRWYEKESGQKVDREVIDRVYYETRGQPGLVSWFGELLTETYNKNNSEITSRDMDYVFIRAVQVLPNNNILNIISKAKQEPYKQTVLDLFRTDEKLKFAFDDPNLNFLYMNGVIDMEDVEDGIYTRFANPFTQKRLFNYFSRELFSDMGKIFTPFENIENIVTETSLNIKNLMRRYENHIAKNRSWMLKDAPRRKDMRIMEAVFHFNLYEYLVRFFESYGSKIWPEFPTGNGKVDILINHGKKLYALEIKTYRDEMAYKKALIQAAKYGKSLGLDKIYLIEFVEFMPDKYREKYEAEYKDKETGVNVLPVFVATGEI